MSIDPSDESLTMLVADTENCELSLFNRLANLSAEDCTGYYMGEREREEEKKEKSERERGGKIGEEIHVHVVGGKEVKRGERKERERERGEADEVQCTLKF